MNKCKLAAEMIVAKNLLHNVALADIDVLQVNEVHTAFNLVAARRFGISLSEDLLYEASALVE